MIRRKQTRMEHDETNVVGGTIHRTSRNSQNDKIKKEERREKDEGGEKEEEI